MSKGPWRGRRLHFVGVGGAGMSAYARVAHELGASVTGSDRASGPYTRRLRDDGVLEALIGHNAANLPANGEVELVYSSAVPAENPERAEARRRGLRERPRAELLAEMTALKRTVAVAGTHGKTTTASMLVCALDGAGMQPGWLVGAVPGEGLPNGRWGAGEWLVVEADESDRSMLSLELEIAVLTNVELDHVDAFGSLAELRELFREFLARAPLAVLPALPELAALRSGPMVRYDVPADRLRLEPGGSRFHWRGHEVRLAVPGLHNALDAAGALEAARLSGASEEAAVRALAGFRGAARRFQLLGRCPAAPEAPAAGAAVYEDYAHHPTEVEATLRAARLLLGGGHRGRCAAENAAGGSTGRLVAVFQPHLYSRTAALARELGRALALADAVVVLEVYAARERGAEHPGVSGRLVAEAAADAAHGRQVYWLPGFDEAERVLRGLLRAGDVCVVLGAGDVDELGRRLIEPPEDEGRGPAAGGREGDVEGLPPGRGAGDPAPGAPAGGAVRGNLQGQG